MSRDSEYGYARCKACDKRMYPRWSEQFKQFSELCFRCMPKSDEAIRNMEQDKDLLKNIVDQHDTGVHGELLKEDEYHEYGSDAMGKLNYFDN